jgi:catechol 2,3-dioxygenase-like lactoylglutathione lyase family enzyme
VRVERLLETAIYGPDLEALERFYVELFGLEPVAHAGPATSCCAAARRR